MLSGISRGGVFSIVALDHRNSLRRIMNPSSSQSVTKRSIESIKLEFCRSFSKIASGILLDSEYGRPAMRAARDSGCGLITCMERSDYIEKGGERITTLMKGFSPKGAKALGAEAVKVLVYYNPNAKSAEHQESLVRNLSVNCKEYGIPLICEVLVYNLGESNFEEEKAGMIIDSARVFSRLGIGLFKSEFPGKIKSEGTGRLRSLCRRITKASKVEWVLLSKGVSYEEFREELKIAVSGGASGFMVGRSLWQEYFSKRTDSERRNFLRNVCARRLKELILIASVK
jgi:tagatose 1,6-diphosphate aldolase